MMAYKNSKNKGKKQQRYVPRPFTKSSSLVNFADQAELYPGAQRSTGKRLNSLVKAASEKSFCSYNVIQGYPEALEIPVDQQHVVSEWRPVVRIEAPYRVELTEEKIKSMPGTFVIQSGVVKQIYKFSKEEAAIKMTKVDSVKLNKFGTVTGVNRITSRKEGIAIAKRNADSFTTLTDFNQSAFPSQEEDLYTEAGGEPLVMSCDGRQGMGFDKKGNSWYFTARQKFKILVECFPSVQEPKRIYLTYVWRWNTMNDMGVLYNVRMLEQKDIRLDFGTGPIALEVSPTLPVAKNLFKMFGPNKFGKSHVDVLFAELQSKFGEEEFDSDDVVDHIRGYYRRNKDLQAAIEDIVKNNHDNGENKLKYILHNSK